MLKELLTLNIFGFFLIFARVGAAITVMPGFSAPFVNVRARLAIALAISFVLGPILAHRLPGLPATAVGLGVLLAGEAIIGAFLGTVALILMDQDFEPLAIYEADRRAVEKELRRPGSKSRNERGALAVSRFKAIGELVWPSEVEPST